MLITAPISKFTDADDEPITDELTHADHLITELVEENEGLRGENARLNAQVEQLERDLDSMVRMHRACLRVVPAIV
jgi:hypothetical protein